MSRIGKKPVVLPSGVTATVSGQKVTVKGAKGELSFTCPEQLSVAKTATGIEVGMREDTKAARAMWGMARTQVVNLIEGVTKGWSKDLDIVGIGYRVEMKGKDTVVFTLGYSHPIEFPLPAGITVAIDPKQTRLTVSGIDRQKVGQVAADMRSLRKPDPYKNKGVRYSDEKLKKKVGKTGAK